MFDGLKNLGNLRELKSKAQEMQGQMKQLQDEMARKTVTADAGGGMVQATVNGRLEVTAIKIDKAKLDTNDTELMEDGIVAAVRAAQAKAAQMMATEMHKLPGGLGLPPGMLPG